MNIPSGFTQAEVSQLTAANPGVVFALPLAAGVTVPADVAPSRVLGWLDILEVPLEAGEAIVLPGPIGIILAGLTKAGLALLRQSLSAAAITERWTVARIQSEIANGLILPKT